ncbi:MAG: hypothetical protein ABIK09_18210 [Pseudomonadota bacterium]
MTMDRRGLSSAAIVLALCLGCTETFGPSRGDDSDSSTGDGVIGVDVPGDDVPGLDSTGDAGLDVPGLDTPGPDSVQPPPTGPIFRVWLTGGASTSTNDEVRVIGGIHPDNGVPSGDGVHWLVPVFRVGPLSK